MQNSGVYEMPYIAADCVLICNAIGNGKLSHGSRISF